MGFLSFLGVVLACPSCFLGLLGFSVFLVRSAPACWGGGAGCGGFRGSGVGAPGCLASFSWGAGRWLASFSWGAGWGVRLRAPECLASFLLGGGRGVCASPGSCCVVVGVGLRPVSSAACCGGGFRVLFFSVRCFLCLLVLRVLGPLLGCGFRGVGGLWGVSGWVRGCFFSGFCCTGPGLFPVSFCGGLVWVWVGFCLESLILAQDERWRRA